MIRFEDAIECLEILADELAGAGDRLNADSLSDIIVLLEEQKQLHIPKHVDNEGDCLRCPNCFHIVYHKNGRCIECGQRYRA